MENAMLVFTFMGLQTPTVAAGSRPVIEVALETIKDYFAE